MICLASFLSSSSNNAKPSSSALSDDAKIASLGARPAGPSPRAAGATTRAAALRTPFDKPFSGSFVAKGEVVIFEKKHEKVLAVQKKFLPLQSRLKRACKNEVSERVSFIDNTERKDQRGKKNRKRSLYI